MQRCQRSVEMTDAFSLIPSVLRVLLKCSEHWYGRCLTVDRESKHLLLEVLQRVQRLGLVPRHPGPTLWDRLGLSAAAGFHRGTLQNNTPDPNLTRSLQCPGRHHLNLCCSLLPNTYAALGCLPMPGSAMGPPVVPKLLIKRPLCRF